jgi:hypothetical protein
VVVGRTDVDSYGAFPPDGAALLRELQAGRPPATASAWYTARFGESVDMEDFLDTLRALDFLVADSEAPAVPAQVRGRRLGRLLFSWPAMVCYSLLMACTLTVCVGDPRLAPHPGNLFFTQYLVVIEVTVFFSQPLLMLLHEYGHVLAGRRLGLRTRLRIGRRLYFLVFETALDGLVVVPRSKRYLPVLAGMLVDVLGMCVLTLAAWSTLRPDGTLPLAGRVCLALAFTAVPRIVAQFYVFLRTDLYHLLVTVLGCSDLHGTARELLANRFNRLRGRTDRLTDESLWQPRDATVARWYAPVYVLGYAAMTLMFCTVFGPVAWRFADTAAHTVLGSSVSAGRFLDATVILAMNAFQLAAVAFGAIRAWRRRRSDRPSEHQLEGTAHATS